MLLVSLPGKMFCRTNILLAAKKKERKKKKPCTVMAGLELLYTRVASSITSPQDAVVCFIHWEIVKRGYKCLGTGDEVRE